MDELSLDRELLRALRSRPGKGLSELADAVGVPRTNFGRRLDHRVLVPIERLIDDGLVEERAGRYRLSERGRRTLADEAADRGSDVALSTASPRTSPADRRATGT
jgi:DNA-binding IclR family transcriptional regulator